VSRLRHHADAHKEKMRTKNRPQAGAQTKGDLSGAREGSEARHSPPHTVRALGVSIRLQQKAAKGGKGGRPGLDRGCGEWR
jgi:hypothetical protein